MLVEDDNNLREIYGERLMAEGYEIVSARDGEEALAIAVKEKPDLIISDVMMPKISGFDMLDILRQTPETKDTKVIMMTALSQAEDKDRASSLGADKYLVKSQVTLEDVARVVQDVLNDTSPNNDNNDPTTGVPANDPVFTEPSTPNSEPLAVVSAPVVEPAPAIEPAPVAEPTTLPPAITEPELEQTTPITPSAMPNEVVSNPMVGTTTVSSDSSETVSSVKPQSAVEELAQVNREIENFVATEQTETPTHQVALVEPTNKELDQAEIDAKKDTNPDPTVIPSATGTEATESASSRKKIISPINGIASTPNINDLYEKELAAEQADSAVLNPSAGVNINAPVEDPSQPNNPMVAAPESLPDSPTMETADLTKIDGITNDDSENTPVPGIPSNPEPVVTSEPIEVKESPAEDPNSPNQIAL